MTVSLRKSPRLSNVDVAILRNLIDKDYVKLSDQLAMRRAELESFTPEVDPMRRELCEESVKYLSRERDNLAVLRSKVADAHENGKGLAAPSF